MMMITQVITENFAKFEKIFVELKVFWLRSLEICVDFVYLVMNLCLFWMNLEMVRVC
jgi:hypothetical protein